MLPCLYLMLLAADPAPPPIRLPAEVTAKPGRLVRLDADTPGTVVRWFALGEVDLLALPGTKSAVAVSPSAGRFLILAWTASGDVPSEAARCVLVVGDPTPPAPVDPLATDLKAAFTADPSPQKTTHARQLASAYRQSITATASARNPAELYAVLKQAVTAAVPTDALPGVRRRIADEVNRILNADADAPMDTVTRAADGKLFARVATLLEELK